MARKHYWQFLVTENGIPVENADISIYEAGTDTAAIVYTTNYSATPVSVAPQTVSSEKGFFEFWIADENEAGGYPVSRKFKIAWSATGVSAGHIDYVDIFSTEVEPVDDTDTGTLANKSIANVQAKQWTDHRATYFNGNVDRGLIPPNPHGIEGYVSLLGNATDDIVNRLISNTDADNWNNTFAIDHTTFSLVDGTRVYTGMPGVSNDTTDPTIDPSNNWDLVHKKYVDDRSYFTLIDTSGTGGPNPAWVWVTDHWEATVAHNLGEDYPVVQVYITGTGVVIYHAEISRVDNDNILLKYDTDEQLAVKVIK